MGCCCKSCYNAIMPAGCAKTTLYFGMKDACRAKQHTAECHFLRFNCFICQNTCNKAAFERRWEDSYVC